jgi:DNA-binding LacI/PurR family transcriptional regulator
MAAQRDLVVLFAGRQQSMGQPTIIDVADFAGVSKSTVSLVLRGSPKVSAATRQSVLRAMEKLDYRPNAMARGLVRRRTNVLGVLLADLRNSFFADVLEGIEQRASWAGYRTLLGTGHRVPAGEARTIESFLELRVDGLILASPRLSDEAILEASERVPVVLISRSIPGAGMDSVMSNGTAGAAGAVDHLVALGHRRIAYIDAGSGASAPERRRGYEEAMRRHGLSEHIRVVRGDYTEAAGALGARQLLAGGPPPTAICTANDMSALGVLDALEEAGLRVPEDISVVGYDNTSVTRLGMIGLTTVDQPRREMGMAAAELLLERLDDGRTHARHVLLTMNPSLVVRTTTAAPKPVFDSDRALASA